MPIDRPIERDEVGARKPLEIGASQVRRGGLDIFQNGEKSFAAFHLPELQAAQKAGECLRHGSVDVDWQSLGRTKDEQ